MTLFVPFRMSGFEFEIKFSRLEGGESRHDDVSREMAPAQKGLENSYINARLREILTI